MSRVGIVPQPASTDYVHEPAAATAAVVTLAAAGAGKRHVIASVAYSYDATPSAGSLTITDGGSAVFKVDVPAAGAKQLTWDPPLLFSANSAVVVTLASGGGTVNGVVSVHTWVQ